MSRVYASSMLERKITELSQELKSLKTDQRYLIGQVSGVESSILKVPSVLDYSVTYDDVTYYYWDIYARFRFIGDGTKATNPVFKYQLYDANGNPVEPVPSSYGLNVPLWNLHLQKGGASPNEEDFIVFLYLVTTRQVSLAFSGDFWCVANSRGELKLVERYSAE